LLRAYIRLIGASFGFFVQYQGKAWVIHAQDFSLIKSCCRYDVRTHCSFFDKGPPIPGAIRPHSLPSRVHMWALSPTMPTNTKSDVMFPPTISAKFRAGIWFAVFKRYRSRDSRYRIDYCFDVDKRVPTVVGLANREGQQQ
jgi:hypothetical protein